MHRDGRFDALDAGNLPPGNLLFVAGDDRNGWFVCHQRQSKVTLYRSATLDRGQWTVMREIDIAFSFWSGSNFFWAWPTATGFAYATSAGDIHLHDLATGAWADRHAPGGDRITNVNRGLDGSLGVLTSPGGGFGGVFAGSHLSRDGGEHWQEIKQPFNVKVSPPLLVAPGTIIVSGGVFSAPELQGSEDMGTSWQRFSVAVGIQDALTYTPSRGLFAVENGRTSFGYATIRHSEDRGRSWQLEYTNGSNGLPLPAYRGE